MEDQTPADRAFQMADQATLLSEQRAPACAGRALPSWLDVAKLRRRAEQASDGEWLSFVKESSNVFDVHLPDRSPVVHWMGFDGIDMTKKQKAANARYIAAAGPRTVIALLDALSCAPVAGEAYTDVNAAMAAEYLRWIDYYHQGRDYDSFLKECVYYREPGHKPAPVDTSSGCSALVAGKAFFWFLPRSDGGYEGPIHNDCIEDVRKLSGAWLPLYTARHAAPPVSAQCQAKDESRPSWLEGGDDAVAMAREDGLLPTASEAVSPARALYDSRLLVALQLTRMALIGHMPQHCNEAIVAAIVAAREALDTALSAYQQQGDKQC